MDDSNIKAMVKVAICGNSDDPHASALGRGVVALLELVEETGSLNKAAKEMGMAYSKAWRIVKDTEEVLGCTFMERRGPRGSVLTDDGRRMVKVFHEFSSRMRKSADEILSQCLEEIK